MREQPGGGLPAGGFQSETSAGTEPHGSPLGSTAAQTTSPKVGVSTFLLSFISFTFSKFLRTSLKVLGSIF